MSFAPFKVSVPATTSNLGPGFDALGLALDFGNVLAVSPASMLTLSFEGEAADALPRDASNLVVRAMDRALAETHTPRPGLRIHGVHQIPASRGLGSSGAATVAGLLIGDALAGGRLGRGRLLELATEMEGHPDNAAPAFFGGLQVCVVREGRVHRLQVPAASHPAVALFIPDQPLPTREARAVVPREIPRASAVFNLSRTGLLVAAYSTGAFEHLAVATEDAIHQTPRSQLLPAMPEVFRAALDAGAYGAFLSGAGSTLAAFCDRAHATTVAEAMSRCAHARSLTGRSRIAHVDLEGARVEPG